MEILGSARAMVGGRAATGSSKYSLRSSSDIGTEAQKYENVLLSGIISPRKRSANWVTLSLERSGWAGIEWQSHCNPVRKHATQCATPLATPHTSKDKLCQRFSP